MAIYQPARYTGTERQARARRRAGWGALVQTPPASTQTSATLQGLAPVASAVGMRQSNPTAGIQAISSTTALHQVRAVAHMSKAMAPLPAVSNIGIPPPPLPAMVSWDDAGPKYESTRSKAALTGGICAPLCTAAPPPAHRMSPHSVDNFNSMHGVTGSLRAAPPESHVANVTSEPSYAECLTETIRQLQSDAMPADVAVCRLWARLSPSDRLRFESEFPQYMHFVVGNSRPAVKTPDPPSTSSKAGGIAHLKAQWVGDDLP